MQIIAATAPVVPTAGMAIHDDAAPTPAGATPLELTLPAGRIRGLRWGRAGGRPVLAVHGWLDNAASFDFLAPRLCRALDLDLVAIDLPGHGLSDWSGRGYAPASQAGALLQVLDALGWQRADLVGHSLGASLATLLAAAVPERVRSLCCLDALGGPAANLADCVPRLRRHLLASFAHPLPEPRPLDNLELGIAARQRANGLGREAASALASRGMQLREGHWHWRSDPALTLPSAFYLEEAQVQALLAALQVPTLVVVASDGPLQQSPQRLAQRRACLPPQASVINLAGGHHLHMEHAASVAPHVLTLLTETAPGP